MNQKSQFSVFSETGPLRQVMLHRPGKEIDRLTIENMDELLFDDLLWLAQAQREHDNFAEILRKDGTEVLYFSDCLADVVDAAPIREQLIKDVFKFECLDRRLSEAFITELMNIPSKELADHLIEGYTKKEVRDICKCNLSLVSSVENGSDFIIHPIPNLYFQRDPAITVANGIIIGQMTFEARRIEPLYWKYITNYHPRFEGMQILFGDAADEVWPQKVEGGDLLVISGDTMAIGVSQRTAPTTVQRIGRNLASRTPIKRIFAFEIPKERYCMHLDTVFTMVDYDKFTIHPEIEGPLSVYEMTLDDHGELQFRALKEELKDILALELKLPAVDLIRCGGGDLLAAQREQWNDGSNTLCIAPGRVITYDRNYVTNELLDKKGIDVISISSAELSRGRGGPRCMSCPVNRDDL